MARSAIDWGAVRVWLLAALAGAAALVFLISSLDLLPPERVTLAAGGQGSAYHAVAERYRAILARDGITLEIVETAGSVENAALLGGGEVDAAILQGGIEPEGETEVEALAGLFVEPLLLFTPVGAERIADPTQWDATVRIAAGPEGSGTRAVVEEAVRRLSLPAPPESLPPLGGMEAAEALLAGEVDGAVFVAPIDAPYLEPLIGSDAVAVAPIRYVDALERRLSFVRVVEVPAAGFDFARGRPPEPIRLPAMVARLAARADLHPALVNRLVEAARTVHSRPDLLTREGEFPSTERLGMEMDAQARALVEDGPGALSGVLPYWLAAQIDRVAVLLVPLIVVALPLLRALPGIYDWRMKARVWRHYDTLVEIDEAAAAAQDEAALDALEARLDAVEAEARDVSVPLSRRGDAYALRLHADHVRRQIAAHRAALAGGAETFAG